MFKKVMSRLRRNGARYSTECFEKEILKYTHGDRERELSVNKGGTTSFRALVLLDEEALFWFHYRRSCFLMKQYTVKDCRNTDKRNYFCEKEKQL